MLQYNYWLYIAVIGKLHMANVMHAAYTGHPQVARKLMETRKALGKTQTDMALLIGIRQQAYSKYETAERGIPIQRLLKICSILGLKIDDIMTLYGT